MAQDAGAPQAIPACTQEVGWRGHPRDCGAPARHGLVAPGSSRIIAMCEFHAELAMDYAGYRIRISWEPGPTDDVEPP